VNLRGAPVTHSFRGWIRSIVRGRTYSRSNYGEHQLLLNWGCCESTEECQDLGMRRMLSLINNKISIVWHTIIDLALEINHRSNLCPNLNLLNLAHRAKPHWLWNDSLNILVTFLTINLCNSYSLFFSSSNNFSIFDESILLPSQINWELLISGRLRITERGARSLMPGVQLVLKSSNNYISPAVEILQLSSIKILLSTEKSQSTRRIFSHGMQEIRVRLPAKVIFFAISLLQFFKIKFGKFERTYIYIRLLIFQIDCIEIATTILIHNYYFWNSHFLIHLNVYEYIIYNSLTS